MIRKTFKRKFLIDNELVKKFAKVSGDNNPIHLSDEYAKDTIFKKPIAHGMLIGSLISNVIANDFPGEGSIYLSQNLVFKKPIYVGSMIEIRLDQLNIKKDKPIATIQTNVFVNNECVIEGSAIVLNDNLRT